MESFYSILLKYVNNISMSILPLNIDGEQLYDICWVNFMIYFMKNQYTTESINNINTVSEYVQNIAKYKYAYLKYINNSNLFDPENKMKNRCNEIFGQAQKIYNGFSRLAYLYRLKYNKIVINMDLSMNTLEKYHRNTVIVINKRNTYLFLLNDIIKIIETALLNHDSFFVEPTCPKNPYTNEIFDASTLYNIYFKMKYSNRVLSLLFHTFFINNFSLRHYYINNEHFLRYNCIKKYVYNTDIHTLYNIILSFISQNMYLSRLKIHKDFPKNTLVTIFKPFLYYKYICMYYFYECDKQKIYSLVLRYKCKYFYEYNKNFGKILSQEDMTFDDKHISFWNIPNISMRNSEIFSTINNIIETYHNIHNTSSYISESEPNPNPNPNPINSPHSYNLFSTSIPILTEQFAPSNLLSMIENNIRPPSTMFNMMDNSINNTLVGVDVEERPVIAEQYNSIPISISFGVLNNQSNAEDIPSDSDEDININSDDEEIDSIS